MAQTNPPVPLPRRQFYLPVKTQDDTPLYCTVIPQSPTKSPEGSMGRSAPPPVPPKTVRVIKKRGGSETDTVEIVKTAVEQSPKDDRKVQPPLPPLRPDWIVTNFSQTAVEQSLKDDRKVQPPLPPVRPDNVYESLHETLVATSLSDCYEENTPWNDLVKDLRLRGATEARIIAVKAGHLSKAIQVYIYKMSECGGTLKHHIYELSCIADNLDKVSKGTKIAGITGGATTAAGSVAAVAGVVLSPFTMGASLALTAVGVSVAAAGGVTGASAAIAHKVNMTQDKKKIDKTLQDYAQISEEIQACLKFINEGMEQLKKHGLSVLSETKMDSAMDTKVVQLVATGRASAMNLEANSKASGLIQGFSLGMDFYFVQGKHGQKVKKGLESKLAKKIRKLVEDLENGLDELIKIKDLFNVHCSRV